METITSSCCTASDKTLDPLSAALMRTIFYFDIFDFPLQFEELFRYCQEHAAPVHEVKIALNGLVEAGWLMEEKDFFFLPGREFVVQRRIEGAQRVPGAMQKALCYSRIIAAFPFVQCICISGSLSKGYMDERSDIDYFVIAKAGRLWLCRTLLVLFRKIFLLNSHQYFCLNYFIDDNILSIPDHNLFTATELAFVIPVYNPELYEKLMQENTWLIHYYPNYTVQLPASCIPHRPRIWRSVTEKMTVGKAGEWLDTCCMKISMTYKKRKFRTLQPEQFNLNLRSQKNVSKHHPQGFQWKVLNALEEKITAFEQQYSIRIR